MFRSFVFFAALLAIALTSAQAAPPAKIMRGDAMVRYGDLNLSRPDDARQMLERLQKASREACGGSPYLRDSRSPTLGYELSAFQECHKAALTKAVATLRSPVVSKLYAQSQALEPLQYAHR